MDYHNRLVLGNQLTDGKYMVVSDIPIVLNLTKVIAAKTMKELLKYELITIDKDDYIVVNQDYCLKGHVSESKQYYTKTRLFENAIRELYEKCKPTEHKKLNLLVTLLPFINYYHNIVCGTPDAEYIRDIEALTLFQLCGAVGYSEENISRLKKDLLALKVNGEDVVAIVETGSSQTITINPRVYYRKSMTKDLEPIYKYFLIKNK